MLSESDLTPQQNAAIDRLYEQDETLLIARVGFGKAIVALTAAQALIHDGHLKRVLVLAPLRVATLTWGPEPDHWAHIHCDVAVACGTPAQRRAACEDVASIVVTNFENVGWILEHYGDTFDGLIIDECTKLKAVGGTAVRKLRNWVKGLAWRVGMTGTPVAEAGQDLYAQALLLDLGKALGTRKEGFLRTYFYPEDFQQRRWLPLPGSEKKIAAALDALVFMADDAGYWDALPPPVDEIMEVELSDYGQDLYDVMAHHSVVTTDEGVEVVAESAGVQSGKLCQIAAGGLYDNDGKLTFDDNRKLGPLAALVDSLDDNVVVVYQYKFELQVLRLMWPGAPVLGDGNKVKPELIEQWNAGEHPVLLMHPRSAAHGLNLQYGSHTLIHLSPCWGADPWAQTLGRLRRRGQKHVVNRYIFMTRGTVEEEIMARLAGKRAAEIEFMDAMAG